MSENEPFIVQKGDANERATGSGRFDDIASSLLPLFADFEDRGSRSWRVLFGFERPKRSTFAEVEFSNRATR